MKVIISSKNKALISNFINNVKSNTNEIVYKLEDSDVANNTLSLLSTINKKEELLSELQNICKEFNDLIINEISSFIKSKAHTSIIFIEMKDRCKIDKLKSIFEDIIILDISENNFNEQLELFLATLKTKQHDY